MPARTWTQGCRGPRVFPPCLFVFVGGIVPPRQPRPPGRPVLPRRPCPCDPNTIRVSPPPWRLPGFSASSRHRVKRCKTKRCSVADSYTAVRRRDMRWSSDHAIPNRSAVLSYALRGDGGSSPRNSRPTPRALGSEVTSCPVSDGLQMSFRGDVRKITPPRKLERCNDIATA